MERTKGSSDRKPAKRERKEERYDGMKGREILKWQLRKREEKVMKDAW